MKSASCWFVYIIGYDARYMQRQIKSLPFVTGQIFYVLLRPISHTIFVFRNTELCCFTVYWLWYPFAVGTFPIINSSEVVELLIY